MQIIRRIYGAGEEANTIYLTRVHLTPMTRWGRLYLHIFHRGDADRDPHDHPFDFWTFPLTSYWEKVMDNEGELIVNKVRRWRWTKREAEHAHRVVGPIRGFPRKLKHNEQGKLVGAKPLKQSFVTIVWRGPTFRRWGFWVHDDHRHFGMAGLYMRTNPTTRGGTRRWLPWRTYVYGEQQTTPFKEVEEEL